MLTRLEASEQMSAIQTALAAGERMLDDRVQAQYMHELERRATGPRKRKKPTTASLEAMGIGVRKEPAKKDDEDAADVSMGGDE